MLHDADGVGTISSRHADDEMNLSVARFLELLAHDVATRPEALVPLSKELVARIERLTEGVAVDLDAPIEGDVVL